MKHLQLTLQQVFERIDKITAYFTERMENETCLSPLVVKKQKIGKKKLTFDLYSEEGWSTWEMKIDLQDILLTPAALWAKREKSLETSK